MSNTPTGKRSKSPKQHRSRSNSLKKERHQEDVCVRTSLPPLVDGPVHGILICHIPKLRWSAKHQSICRSATIKVSWWGEDDTFAIFKPQTAGTPIDYHQKPNTTAKYYVRSELRQFNKYLTDAGELVLRVLDSETSRFLGTAKVQNLSTLTVQNPIKGYQSMFTNKGEKLGEILVCLRLMLPGTHDSTDNLVGLSMISDSSNPPSRRNSFGASDYQKNDHLDNGLRTFTIDRTDATVPHSVTHSNDIAKQIRRPDTTMPFQAYTTAQPGVQAYKELPTGEVVEALIERANRLREDMIKSTHKTSSVKEPYLLEPTALLNKNNNNSEAISRKHRAKSADLIPDDLDPSLDNDNICDILGIKASMKSSTNLNESNESILTDLDGLENEQSLLDDLLYGRRVEDSTSDAPVKSSHHSPNRRPPRGKPPTGRSPSPSLARVGGIQNRSRSSRSRSLAQSSDSDTASRVSFDMPSSDVEESGNESHDEDQLSKERLHLLSFIRTARLRIDYLRLHALMVGRESPSHSSFGRTNKSKRAMTYFIEYQFPVIANSRDGQKNEATEVMKVASKRFESNNDINFSHLSNYPCLFNENTVRNWWRSLLIFKIYSRMSGTASPEQIGFAVLPLRSILRAESLHLEQTLNVVDRTQINQQKLPNKVSKKCCIGNLQVMLELDSDAPNFKLELDRVRLIEQSRPKNSIKSKGKKSKKSKKIRLVEPNQQQLPKAFLSEGFLNNDASNDMTDGLVVQIYLSIVEARNIPQVAHNNHLPRNPYFVCRAFWNDQPITSVVCWGSTSPRFNFEQKIPLLLTRTTLEKMHQNFVIIELWDKKISGPSDQLIGIVKIPLEQFYVSFKDKQISRVLLRAQYPVISTDNWLRIIDPFTTTGKSSGELQVLLAMGTSDQITAVQMAHGNGQLLSNPIENKQIESQETSSSLIEHHFEVMIETINGLRAFESMIWGESDCFIQYSFPTQQDQADLRQANSLKPFQLKTMRTAATLCTSDPTFHDSQKFRYVLSPADALHKYFYAACQTSSMMDTSIPFEVWSRFYYPNIRDQLLAKGKLPAAKLCSMTTMLNAESDENKSVQSFRIPLEIVREDPKHEQNRFSTAPAYGGDILLTVTYKRVILKANDRQLMVDRLVTSQSQVCISIGVTRACGLKHAIQSQARHDTRLAYPAQVGINSYARLSLSFLSDMESRTTRTIARSFVPEFNHSIDFPVPLVWTDHRQKSISLAEMLEHGELRIDLFHQMNPSDHVEERKPVDIHLCYSTIPLRDLLSHHTGIKGWFPLANVQTQGLTEISEHCVGGLELFVRFAQQEDRRRVIDSAKRSGWLDDNYMDEENFLDDQKDLGCLVTLSIDRIQIPIHLATRPGKDRVDERTSVFVQYRLYDKMPIITKRKKPIIDRHNLICELQFHKEHLFLCSEPFLWYLREEKLEIQIWTSETDTYDYSQPSSLSTTDKMIGSVYVDLYRLCDRKRKSHRFNAILPMFKAACKDLAGASVQVHMTIDKSKDFNELRSRNGTAIDTSNDAELDSYLENRHLNLIGNDRALRTLTNNLFSVVVQIEQAAHLPTVYSKQQNAHIPPNPYVTYSTAESNHLCRTQVLTSTSKPVWNYQQAVKLAVEHLFNEKKTFILKVWHKINADIETIPEKSGDKVLGFVSIDLSPLLSGLQQISGWYNIVDTIGNVQGQLKITIVPQEDLFELKRFKYQSSNNANRSDSHRSSATTSQTSSTTLAELSARSTLQPSSVGQNSLNSSMIDDEQKKPSYLMDNLRRQLGELDAITERLKNRYNGNVAAPSNSQSNATTARSHSVPPDQAMPPLELPIHNNTGRSEVETNRSTSTTMQTDFLEQFPESLSGRPLMSNGLNVTDVLSLHNDRVRQAQELMSKANHLLETSKDFFTKTSTTPPPPPAPPAIPLTVIDRPPPTPPPSILPNFNATSEFYSEPKSPQPVHNDLLRPMNDHHGNGDSIVWSDDEDEHDEEHNGSFLPIGLPPTHHRSNALQVPSPVPEPETIVGSNEHQQQDEIDIIRPRPLNDLSAFNFDCQQMNAERLNGVQSSSPPVVRRAIFSPSRTADDRQVVERSPRESSMEPIRSMNGLVDSHSSSVQFAQESFASDASVIDKRWLNDHQRTREKNHPAAPSPTTHQAPVSRSPHLAFLDRPFPNFFPSNREMEASIKQVTHGLSRPDGSISSNHPTKNIIERLRTKSSSDLLRGVSPINGLSAVTTNDSSNVNVKRLEKIFKGK